MSANVVVYLYEDIAVRTVELDGETWFVGRDVCRVLGLQNESQALTRLDEDERRDGVSITDPMGRSQTVVAISEPAIYRLIFQSRRPEAEKFKRWLAHDVVPQIRKTGRFAPVEALPSIDGFDDRALALINAKAELVRLHLRIKGPTAAAQLWTYLGLPEPTARGAQATPAHDGARCLAHLLAHRDIEGRTVAKLLEAALGGGDMFEEFDLGVLGLRLAEDGAGVVFANGYDELVKACAGTPWADGRWSQALKRLPGAHPVGAQRFGGVTCRGVFVPGDVILDAATSLDPH